MGRKLIAGLVVGFLMLTFATAAYASYAGIGVTNSPHWSLREGSTGGVAVFGGGPGSGK
jgi:hypothetical protein